MARQPKEVFPRRQDKDEGNEEICKKEKHVFIMNNSREINSIP